MASWQTKALSGQHFAHFRCLPSCFLMAVQTACINNWVCPTSWLYDGEWAFSGCNALWRILFNAAHGVRWVYGGLQEHTGREGTLTSAVPDLYLQHGLASPVHIFWWTGMKTNENIWMNDRPGKTTLFIYFIHKLAQCSFFTWLEVQHLKSFQKQKTR